MYIKLHIQNHRNQGIMIIHFPLIMPTKYQQYKESDNINANFQKLLIFVTYYSKNYSIENLISNEF